MQFSARERRGEGGVVFLKKSMDLFCRKWYIYNNTLAKSAQFYSVLIHTPQASQESFFENATRPHRVCRLCLPPKVNWPILQEMMYITILFTKRVQHSNPYRIRIMAGTKIEHMSPPNAQHKTQRGRGLCLVKKSMDLFCKRCYI